MRAMWKGWCGKVPVNQRLKVEAPSETGFREVNLTHPPPAPGLLQIMVMDMDGQTLDDNANRSSAMAVLDSIQEKKEQDDKSTMDAAREHGVR